MSVTLEVIDNVRLSFIKVTCSLFFNWRIANKLTPLYCWYILKGGSMAEQTVRGSCLCKSVRYEVSTPFARFGHCYCSRCRKATGGVRSTNIAVPIAQFHWTQGEELIKRFDLPEAKSFARQICGNCNCPVPHASRDGQRAIVPAGTLDDVPPGKPAAHGHWSSRVSWVEINESDLPCTD
jgi:hypothetical protein